MTDHRETRRVLRQRHRKAQHLRETQARDAYNREGIDGCVRALGGGDAEDWNHDRTEGQDDE